MKFTKTYEINLNVEKIVEDFKFTEETTEKEIVGKIYEFLCTQDDNVFYAVSAEEVYKAYEKEFCEAIQKVKNKWKKTYKEIFFTLFPNVGTEYGYPNGCVKKYDEDVECYCERGCLECHKVFWDRPAPEEFQDKKEK